MSLQKRVSNSNLPIKQTKVIEAILDDLESNSFLTGSELCDKFHISFSSLTRMSKSLNYSGFPELKKEIERLYKSEKSPTLQAENFISDTKKDSILNVVYQSELNGFKKLMSGLNEEDLILTAKKINQAKRVFIIGIGQLFPIATKFSESLKLLSKTTLLFTELGFSKAVEVHSLCKNDVIITFSMNKELIELQDFLIKTKRSGSFTTLFTDNKVGQLQKHASVSINTPSTGSAMINCLTSYLIVTNIIESYLFSLDKHVHLTKIKNIEKNWNSLPLFLN